MSYLYRLVSASDASGDTTARGASIVLAPLSTVSTQAACMRAENVVCTLPALNIGGQAGLPGQAVTHDVQQVRWTRLSLYVGVCVCWCVLPLTCPSPVLNPGQRMFIHTEEQDRSRVGDVQDLFF